MKEDIVEEARKETQEYIHAIGERIHKLQILAKKCYDAVREFNEEMEDFSSAYPELIPIDHKLRLGIELTTEDQLEQYPQLL